MRGIVQDSLGFMWIATEGGGVARYDGSTMWPLTRATNSDRALLSSFITTLEIAPNGALWIGTGDAGISVYNHDSDTLTHYQHSKSDDSLSSNGVLAIFCDESDVIWIGTDDGVLNRFDQQSGGFERIDLLDDKDAPITVIAQRGQGSLWIGTDGAGLLGYDQAKAAVTVRYRESDGADGLPDDTVRALLLDDGEGSAGSAWIGTDRGLVRLGAEGEVLARYRHREHRRDSLSDDRVTVLMRARDGVLWVGTRSGLNAMDAQTGKFTRYAPDRAYPVITSSYPNQVSAAYQDRTGVLWFGTQAGLRKLDPVRANLDHYVNASGEGDRMCFAEGDPGVLWAGTYAGGVQRIDHKRGEITTYAQLGRPGASDFVAFDEWITALYHDSERVLWMSGVGLGLIAFDTRSGEHTHYRPDPSGLNGPTVDRIDRIVEAEDGRLWLASWGGGLLRFDRATGEFTDYVSVEDEPDSLSSDYLYTIHIDRRDANVIWVGTAYGGLNRFDTSTETAEHYGLAPQGSDAAGYASVVSIHQDDAGVLWLGTHSGLVSLDPSSGQLGNFSGHSGLASTIYGILADADGTLWVGTNGSGLIAFDPKKKTVDIYTAADGFASKEFNQGGLYRLQTARCWCLVSAGSTRFDPRTFSPIDTLPRQ